MVPLSGEGATDKSPPVLQCKWHTSSLAIWSAFYLRSLESNDSRVSQVPFAFVLHVVCYDVMLTGLLK